MIKSQIKIKAVTIYYTVCQYVPDPARNERLNIGMAIHIPQLKFSKFYYHDQSQRLQAFDPDNDLRFMKISLTSFTEIFDAAKQNIYPDFADVTQENFLRDRTQYFVNCFRFSPIKKITVVPEQVDKTVDWLKQRLI